MSAARVILREGAWESHVIMLGVGLTKVTVAMTDGRHALLDVRVSGYRQVIVRDSGALQLCADVAPAPIPP